MKSVRLLEALLHFRPDLVFVNVENKSWSHINTGAVKGNENLSKIVRVPLMVLVGLKFH